MVFFDESMSESHENGLRFKIAQELEELGHFSFIARFETHENGVRISLR